MFYGQDLAFMGFALPQDSRLVNVRAAQKQKLMGRGGMKWNAFSDIRNKSIEEMINHSSAHWLANDVEI